MKKIVVIGAGGIGRSLADRVARATKGSVPIVLVDNNPGARNLAVVYFAKKVESAGHRADKKGLDADAAKTKETARLANITVSGEIADIAGAGFVIEAASENLEVKHAILAAIEGIVADNCVIGHTTSGITLREIAANAAHPERCFIMHPFFPADRNPGMEIVAWSTDAPTELVLGLMLEMSFVPMVVGDRECFAGNVIFTPIINVALRMMESGVATWNQIDAILADRLGGGGVFKIHDIIPGNANALTRECVERMGWAFRNDWYLPCDTLRDAADQNRAWYDGSDFDASYSAVDLAEEVMEPIWAALFALALELVEEEVIDAFRLNWMTRVVLAFKEGIFDTMARMGQDEVYRIIGKAYAQDQNHPMPTCVLENSSMPHAFKDVLVEKDLETGIATITVFRPEAMNAIRRTTIAELMLMLVDLEMDDDVRGVIFTGFGGILAGADVNGIAACKTPEEMARFPSMGQALTLRMQTFSKPIVAVHDGFTFGGGAELGMACWQRVVGPKAVVGQPEVKLGIIPGWGGTVRLMRLIGVPLALRWMRTGEPVNAGTATTFDWGIYAPDPMAKAVGLLTAHFDDSALLKPMSLEPMETDDVVVPEVELGHLSRALDAILVETVLANTSLTVSDGLVNEAAAMGRVGELEDCRIGLTNFVTNGPHVPAQFINA